MTKEIPVHIRRPDKNLLEQVKRIAEEPTGDAPEVRSQIETLAKAIGEVAAHCADLHSVLETLIKRATFKARG
jgi:hypothetical protein